MTDYLVLKREAIEAYRQGLFWEAVLNLKTLISSIPLSRQNYNRADEIIKLINKIDSDTSQVKGITGESAKWNKFQYRNNRSRKHFDEILRDITTILQEQGYFEFLTRTYGPRIEAVDMSKAVRV